MAAGPAVGEGVPPTTAGPLLPADTGVSDGIQLGELRLAFEHFGEKHKKGWLMTQKQLLDAAHYLGYNPTKKQLQAVGKQCPGDPTTPWITFDSFCAFLGTQMKTTAQTLLNAFAIIDENGDGQLSAEEFEKYLTTFGERMSKSEIQVLLKEFDADGSGTVDYTEFCDMLVEVVGGATSRPPLPPAALDESTLATVADETPGDAEDAAEWYAEPPDLLEPGRWFGDRLHGSFQVGRSPGRVLSQLYSFQLAEPDEVHLSLRMVREATQPAAVDCRFYVIRLVLGHDGERYPELVATSQLLGHSDPALNLTLDAGEYYVLPFSTGCNLRHRRGPEPPLAPLLVQGPAGGDDEVLSTALRAALQYTFGRFDFDGTGTLSRSEFSMRSLFVDGEVPPDEDWEVLVNHFDVEDGELTFEGWCGLHELSLRGDLANDRTELDFYRQNLEPLGLSPTLAPDHVAKFVLFCFSRKPRAGLRALPTNERLVEQVDLLDVLETAEHRPGLTDGLQLYVRQDGHHASFAVRNITATHQKCRVNFGKSIEAVINHDTLDGLEYTVSPGGAVVVAHLVPAPRTSAWHPVFEGQVL
mmetsp:Transcript_4460/g.11341  ORF Transcript_4460/g.11341 Transcript_4460/m.11341 type:complete len:583 (+) Transcript_4460:71-1819(+)